MIPTNATVAPPLVLLVEDEPILRELITMALEDLGVTVTAVATAEEGAAVLPEQPWALLLTDVRTPGALDGLELAHRARRQRPSLGIVVMSGYHDRLSAPLPQDVAFLAKPWTLESFHALVAEMLGDTATRH